MAILSTTWWNSARGEPDGGRLYAIHCAACHGDRGGGGIGVPLSLPDFLSSVTDEYLFLTIRHGRPGRIMPAFRHLSEQQTWAIVGHIRAWASGETRLAPEGTPGDPQRGRDIFARHCARCHGPLGKGGTGTGVNFTRLHDQPVVAPGLNNPGFLAAASDRIIRTTLLKGRRGTPMQSAAKMGLSEQDVDDVVSFIRSFEKSFENSAVDPEADADPALMVTSPLPFAETVKRLKQAISARRQRIIREHPLDDGLTGARESGRSRHLAIYFGNIRHLNTLLAIDPRIGIFLPSRITVTEGEDGKVTVTAVNPLRFRNLFNNTRLEHTSREMHELYVAILGEISE